MLAHFGTLVPSQRTPELLRELRYGFRYGIYNRLGSMPCKCRPLLVAGLMSMSR